VSVQTGAGKTESMGPQPGGQGCGVSCARQISQGLACVTLAQETDVVNVFVAEEAVATLSGRVLSARLPRNLTWTSVIPDRGFTPEEK